MPSFGKRPNAGDFGVVLQHGKRPLTCRVVERTLRIVRIVVADPAQISDQFTLVVDNGATQLCCQALSAAKDYIVARYSSPDSADCVTMLTRAASHLEEIEQWKGAF